MNLKQSEKRREGLGELNKSASTTPDSGSMPDVGWSIDKGIKRESNEDNLATVTFHRTGTDSQTVGVYAVADGLGGHQSGEVASKLAVRTAIRNLIQEATSHDDEMPENYRQWLEQAIVVANRVVQNRAHDDHTDMGTTLVMAVVVGYDVHIANVGDSRAYLISATGIRQITHDQSVAQILIDHGEMTPEQAENHPYRNILTQAVGLKANVKVDLLTETFGEHESLLLCSDGLWTMLGDEEILQIVRAAITPSAACQALVDACNAKGGRDNIAAVLVRSGEPKAD